MEQEQLQAEADELEKQKHDKRSRADKKVRLFHKLSHTLYKGVHTCGVKLMGANTSVKCVLIWDRVCLLSDFKYV